MYFATTNKNKIAEAERILGTRIESVALEIDEVQTLDPLECASKKALAAYHSFGQPVLVEDTTLFFAAWEELPGVFIDYFMKTLGNAGILKLMENETNRNAYAQTTLAISPGGRTAETFVGRINGSIPTQERGNQGFGWDPIFIPDGSEKTFAEMSGPEKDRFSMRKLAFEKYKQSLEE